METKKPWRTRLEIEAASSWNLPGVYSPWVIWLFDPKIWTSFVKKKSNEKSHSINIVLKLWKINIIWSAFRVIFFQMLSYHLPFSSFYKTDQFGLVLVVIVTNLQLWLPPAFFSLTYSGTFFFESSNKSLYSKHKTEYFPFRGPINAWLIPVTRFGRKWKWSECIFTLDSFRQ